MNTLLLFGIFLCLGGGSLLLLMGAAGIAAIAWLFQPKVFFSILALILLFNIPTIQKNLQESAQLRETNTMRQRQITQEVHIKVTHLHSKYVEGGCSNDGSYDPSGKCWGLSTGTYVSPSYKISWRAQNTSNQSAQIDWDIVLYDSNGKDVIGHHNGDGYGSLSTYIPAHEVRYCNTNVSIESLPKHWCYAVVPKGAY